MSSIEWDDNELQKALKDLEKCMPDAVMDCMEQACLKVEADAKANCPSDTGELRRSIQTEVKNEGGNITGVVGTNLDYAPYVHQGTGIYATDGNGRKDVPWVYYSDRLGHFVKTDGIHPTPFLEMAFEANRKSIVDYFKGVAAKCLK